MIKTGKNPFMSSVISDISSEVYTDANNNGQYRITVKTQDNTLKFDSASEVNTLNLYDCAVITPKILVLRDTLAELSKILNK